MPPNLGTTITSLVIAAVGTLAGIVFLLYGLNASLSAGGYLVVAICVFCFYALIGVLTERPRIYHALHEREERRNQR